MLVSSSYRLSLRVLYPPPSRARYQQIIQYFLQGWQRQRVERDDYGGAIFVVVYLIVYKSRLVVAIKLLNVKLDFVHKPWSFKMQTTSKGFVHVIKIVKKGRGFLIFFNNSETGITVCKSFHNFTFQFSVSKKTW